MFGAGFYPPAVIATSFVISVNLFLRPLVQVVGRRPASASEEPIYVQSGSSVTENLKPKFARFSCAILCPCCIFRNFESSNIEGSNRAEVTALVRGDSRQDRVLEPIVGA